MIDDLFKTRTGIIIVSVIWGLGLSTLFRKACEGRKCQVIKHVGPDFDEVAGTYYNYGTSSCYQYHPVMTKCNK